MSRPFKGTFAKTADRCKTDAELVGFLGVLSDNTKAWAKDVTENPVRAIENLEDIAAGIRRVAKILRDRIYTLGVKAAQQADGS